MVLVDGKGPIDPLAASLGWLGNLAGRPPTDGQSTLFDVARHGRRRPRVGRDSLRDGADHLSRNVQTLADRFVVVLDDVATADRTAHDLTWQLHGNGGGTSGGTYEPQPRGARWTIASGRLRRERSRRRTRISRSRIASRNTKCPTRSSAPTWRSRRRCAARSTRMLQVLVPSDATTAPPVITDRSRPGLAAVTATTSDGLRLDAALWSALRPVSDHPAGGPAIDTDGWYAATVHAGSALVSLAVEGATYVRLDGVTLLTTATPGTITMDRSGAGYEVHADGAAPGSRPAARCRTAAVDGVCGVTATVAGVAPQLLSNRARSCSTPMATPYRRPMPAATSAPWSAARFVSQVGRAISTTRSPAGAGNWSRRRPGARGD